MSEALRRGRRRRRRLAATLAVLAALVGGGTYAAATLSAPLPAPVVALAVPAPPTAPAAAPAWPADVAAAAAGVLGHPAVVSGPRGEEPMPIASIAKLVTALVVLDAAPLAPGESGPSFTLDASDLAILAEVRAVDGSSLPVAEGLTLTQRQLLEGMLVPSANNYAVSLVTRVFGGVEAYLAAARAWLDANGLGGVRVADATGLSEADTASAADVVRLGMRALEHPVIAEIVRMASVELPLAGEARSTNALLGRDGIVGVKTGTSSIAGPCLLVAREVTVAGQPRTVVAAVLGAADSAARFAAGGALADATAGTLVPVVLVEPGAAVGELRTAWGDRARLVTGSGASALLWNAQEVRTDASVPVPAVPLADGATVGSIEYSGVGVGAAVPLLASGALREPDAWWRLTHPGELFGW